MANENNGINLSVTNPQGDPVIYRDTPASTLTYALTNLTGVDVTFTTGSNANTLTVLFPPSFALSGLSIQLDGWTFSSAGDGAPLLLTYTGGGVGYWHDGDVLSFTVTGVQTTASASAGTTQVNLGHFPNGVPTQVNTPLSIADQPQPGNADLTKVLQVSLDSQGGVLVSPSNDPLQNTLFLNIKNIGDTPLYTGSSAWTGNPTVTVVFVYGTTTGSLTPDDMTGVGSAWNIDAGIPYQQPQNIWTATNPSSSSTGLHPAWLLQPSSLNEGIIGTGASANITFSFSDIVSFTPPGHTQMLVQFSGFMKDENTRYDDATFVLDIAKQNAPATRGLINFFSPDPIYTVSQPNTPIIIPIRWAMFDVASVTIITSFPGISPITLTYPNPPTIAYDNTVVTIPGITQSTAVTITIQAYSGNGGFLNSMQFTAYLQANMFVDPRDGKVYPVVKVNNRVWMAENLDYSASSGSMVYGPEAQYGRLYQFAAAQPQNIAGWRLPNQEDWQDLLATFTYAQLLADGDSGFAAQLNGSANSSGSPSNLGVYGYYWSGVESGSTVGYVSFSSRSQSVSYIDAEQGMSPQSYLSVRYVKDVA